MRCYTLIFLLFSYAAWGQTVAQNKDIIAIKGKAINASDKTVIPNLPVFLLKNDSCYLTTKTNTEGIFQFNVNLNSIKSLSLYSIPNKDVKTSTAPQGFFLNKKETINLNDSIKDKYVLLLSPVPRGDIRLPSFQFRKNSLDMIDSTISYDNNYLKSKDELNLAFEMLDKNPSLTLELAGHCSTDEKNPDELSLQRAEKIKQTLVDKGIEKDRLTVKGWGIKKLKVTTTQILKGKTQKEKEELNEKNRRVVFKITGWTYYKSFEKPMCN